MVLGGGGILPLFGQSTPNGGVKKNAKGRDSLLEANPSDPLFQTFNHKFQNYLGLS